MEQWTVNTSSPINTERLKGQNLRLFKYLESGATIHCLHPAIKQLRIGYLNSRASDLTKFLRSQGKELYRRGIKAPDADGVLTDVKEYSLSPFN